MLFFSGEIQRQFMFVSEEMIIEALLRTEACVPHYLFR
jgi:hypothetical protein